MSMLLESPGASVDAGNTAGAEAFSGDMSQPPTEPIDMAAILALR
jgi:hypothetical protein